VQIHIVINIIIQVQVHLKVALMVQHMFHQLTNVGYILQAGFIVVHLEHYPEQLVIHVVVEHCLVHHVFKQQALIPLQPIAVQVAIQAVDPVVA
jgi:hypothetical protein